MNDESQLQVIEAAGGALADARQERQELVKEMERAGIDEREIATTLAHILKSATCATPTGEIVEDFSTKLAAIKTWHKMKSGQPDVQVNIAQIFQKKGL